MRVMNLNGRTGTVKDVLTEGVVDVVLDHPYMNGWGRQVKEERQFTTQLRFVDENNKPIGAPGEVFQALKAASAEHKNRLRELLSKHTGHSAAEAIRDRMNELRKQGPIRAGDVTEALTSLESLAD
jgi:hypothetical protein